MHTFGIALVRKCERINNVQRWRQTATEQSLTYHYCAIPKTNLIHRLMVP